MCQYAATGRTRSTCHRFAMMSEQVRLSGVMAAVVSQGCPAYVYICDTQPHDASSVRSQALGLRPAIT